MAQTEEELQKEASHIVEGILSIWSEAYFIPAEKNGDNPWKYYIRTQNIDYEAKRVSIEARFSQPLSKAPVPLAIGTVGFDVQKKLGHASSEQHWVASYSFEGSLVSQSLSVPLIRGLGDVFHDTVRKNILGQARTLSNPLKRIREVIESKHVEAKAQKDLLKKEDQTNFVLKGGPGKPFVETFVYKPTLQDTVLLVCRKYAKQLETSA